MAWTIWIFLGAVFAGSAVGLGAFGAHALKDRMLSEHLQVFETATRYQMYHALALLFIGLLILRVDNLTMKLAASSMAVGVVLFSGSLYLIVLAGQRQLGIITPIGGVFLIVGWLLLAGSVFTL